jgi:DNA-binding MarR family transcriptional regulator
MKGSPPGTSRVHASDSALAFEIEFLVVKASVQGTRLANRYLAPLGLRVRSYSVLALACGGIDPTQRELAEFLALDPSQIVALVDELERDGFVRREVAPADRRSNVVRATDAGQALFAEATSHTRVAESDALAVLTMGERDQLRTLLRRVLFPPTDPTQPTSP